MGKSYSTEISFDIRQLNKILFGKVKCKKCGSKMKIAKNKLYKGKGTTHMKGYHDNIKGSPITFRWSKQIFVNQERYEIKYFYKCCNCEEECTFDEI